MTKNPTFIENPDKIRVVVTGGAGFIGSNIVRRLLEKKLHVTVLDDFSTGDEENLPNGGDRLEVIEGSVTDWELVRKIVAKANTVIHLAARNIIVSTSNPREDFEVNIGGTLNVLMAARERPGCRVVYASSASIYGNSRYLPINEDDPPNPLSPYSVSKFAGESYCRAFYESYGVSTAVVRYSNVYGPGQSYKNPYCGVIARFFAAAINGETLAIHGDGEQTRDFTYVDDVAEGTLLAAFSPKAEGQVYNLATGREVSINYLARLILEITGRGSDISWTDRRDIDNIRRRVLNIEKIRRDLRWIPSVPLEAGLQKTFEWLKRKDWILGPRCKEKGGKWGRTSVSYALSRHGMKQELSGTLSEGYQEI